MAVERNGRVYAKRTLIGDHGDNFFNQTPLEKALDLGWSEGCPVAVTLTRETEEGGRGALLMARRYGEINFWSGYITRVLQEQKRDDLLRNLPGCFKRFSDEPIGKHDEGWPPEELQEFMFLIPHAYSLPRLLINYINGARDTTIDEKQERMAIAVDCVERVSSNAENLDALLVNLTLQLVRHGGNIHTLLKTMISQGKLDEDNCKWAYQSIVREMKNTTPELYVTYQKISSEERARLGIADIHID